MTKKIVLGGGCFWCIEAIFQQIKGVTHVVSGYAGAQGAVPSYEEVCTGKTGYAEVVEVSFNSAEISLTEILDIFFHLHNPTTPNQQGADCGTQYRSVVYYNTEDEKEIIHKAAAAAQPDWQNPIVTEIAANQIFYSAEQYHQNYFNNNSQQGYCQLVISPKLSKLKERYFEKTI